MSIIKKLVKKGLLDKQKATSLEFEIKNSGKKEEEELINQGIVPEELLFRLKGEELKIPLRSVNLDNITIEVLEKIPEESARFYRMVPLEAKDKELVVGMVFPEDLKSQEALKFLARQGSFSYKVFLITLTDYKEVLKKYRSLKKEVGLALEELGEEMKADEDGPRGSKDIETLISEAPISKVVAVLVRHAVEGKASDIHIEPGKERLRIRFRLLGMLHSSIILPMRIHPAVVARIKILCKMKLDETRRPQDGRFSTKIDNNTIDFRVSTFPTVLGEKVAIRVLDPMAGIKSFEELGLTDNNLKSVKEASKKPFGLIMVTGPTGSGKSTTLYTTLQYLNKEDVNIVTLEDPVEYHIEGINQSQIRPEIKYTFATGLRHILRQDPDIIMVGEIRDEETAALAIHAALTGHIVLTTLHTNNAIGVIPRLTDLGVQPYLIPAALNVVIAQRLIRRLCPHCRKKVRPTKQTEGFIIKQLASLPENIKKDLKIPKPLYVYQSVGCPKCGKAGFTGRIGVFEAISMTNRLSEIILKGFTEVDIKKEAENQGMVTMMQDGIIKALAGVSTIEDVLRVAAER